MEIGILTTNAEPMRHDPGMERVNQYLKLNIINVNLLISWRFRHISHLTVRVRAGIASTGTFEKLQPRNLRAQREFPPAFPLFVVFFAQEFFWGCWPARFLAVS